MKHLIIVGAWLIIYIVALAFIAVKVVFVESVLLRRGDIFDSLLFL
ncbi:hypothetical protein [Clostridium tagluense]|nr:hypothetical protein [Clostridium tagluense]